MTEVVLLGTHVTETGASSSERHQDREELNERKRHGKGKTKVMSTCIAPPREASLWCSRYNGLTENAGPENGGPK